jgi:CheY-like chemotaxis protein
VAENGQVAVDKFSQSEPGAYDMIFMDVQMPVMNGHEAARAIRALDRPDAREIPIIAMTANAFAEDEREALAAGMSAHVAKPIDVAVLACTVASLAH